MQNFHKKTLFSFNFANNWQNTKARRWWVVRNTGGRLTGQWKMWIPCYTWTSRADWLQVVAAPGLASGIFEQFGARRNSQVWQPLGNPEEGTTDHLPPTSCFKMPSFVGQRMHRFPSRILVCDAINSFYKYTNTHQGMSACAPTCDAINSFCKLRLHVPAFSSLAQLSRSSSITLQSP